jgi:flagellar biosynthesis/type III secretory pathway chaperone
MKFLEFHFNPKLAKKKDTIFDTFCFVPETKEEENLGYLYLIGEITNVLPKTKGLIHTLSEIIKREFYKLPKRGIEESFKEALTRANIFLAQEIKKENVSWLGHLNFAVISTNPDFLINLSKVGNLKILLLRDGEIFNIAETINFESSPTKIFPNLVEGKVSQGDKILLTTQEVFQVFDREGIFQNLTKVKKPREIKKIFKEKKKILKEISGCCLIITPEKKRILFKKIYFPKISFPAKKLILFSSLLEKISPQSPILQEKLKKDLVAILILAILLFLGWLIFR